MKSEKVLFGEQIIEHPKGVLFYFDFYLQLVSIYICLK